MEEFEQAMQKVRGAYSKLHTMTQAPTLDAGLKAVINNTQTATKNNTDLCLDGGTPTLLAFLLKVFVSG